MIVYLGVLAGFLFSNTPVYAAPGAKLLWEVDFGLFVSAIVSAVAYIVFLYIFPEPRDAFGPEGAKIKSSDQYANTPIQQK